MNLFDKFTNPNYIKKFNYFLKKVVEPAFNEKYKKNYSGKFDFSLYGIDIKPKEPYIPGEDFSDYRPDELGVTFFIDTTPNDIPQNFFFEVIFGRGEKILDFSLDNYFGTPGTFMVNFLFNKRSLNPITYVTGNNIQEKVNPSERAIKNKKQDDLPFDEVNESSVKRRTFKSGINEHELKWHFDERDRKVKVVKSNGWKIQFDNEIPKNLNEGDTLFIPKGVYHRVIKGNDELIVKIKEL